MRFVLRLALCYFVLVLFSPLSIAITSLGEERVCLDAFRAFVRFALVWFCLFPHPLGVWDGLRFVIVALPRLFSYPFLVIMILFVVWRQVVIGPFALFRHTGFDYLCFAVIFLR